MNEPKDDKLAVPKEPDVRVTFRGLVKEYGFWGTLVELAVPVIVLLGVLGIIGMIGDTGSEADQVIFFWMAAPLLIMLAIGVLALLLLLALYALGLVMTIPFWALVIILLLLVLIFR